MFAGIVIQNKEGIIVKETLIIVFILLWLHLNAIPFTSEVIISHTLVAPDAKLKHFQALGTGTGVALYSLTHLALDCRRTSRPARGRVDDFFWGHIH